MSNTVFLRLEDALEQKTPSNKRRTGSGSKRNKRRPRIKDALIQKIGDSNFGALMAHYTQRTREAHKVTQAMPSTRTGGGCTHTRTTIEARTQQAHNGTRKSTYDFDS